MEQINKDPTQWMSSCCKGKVYVWGSNEGTYHHVCYDCDKPCDALAALPEPPLEF